MDWRKWGKEKKGHAEHSITQVKSPEGEKGEVQLPILLGYIVDQRTSGSSY